MAENTPGEVVNRSRLAALHGVSLPTIDAWVREGMPVVKRGSRGVEWEFDPAACYAWRMQRELDKSKREADAGGGDPESLDALERRKLLAQTVEAELKLAKARGEVADVALMERNLARAFATVRASLRQVPSRAVSLLIGETDERRFKSVLLQEIDQALDVLATADLMAEEADEDDDE